MKEKEKLRRENSYKQIQRDRNQSERRSAKIPQKLMMNKSGSVLCVWSLTAIVDRRNAGFNASLVMDGHTQSVLRMKDLHSMFAIIVRVT